ncbi:MAG: DUF4336 domain-containing protein [Deltaproteobacteria bacterium]|nr:DUF4336 domain-containing protein [Deltaproteobacteria bacterium]
MHELADGLWIAEARLRFLGLELGARMTVVRLAGGELLLHSPVAATEELVRQVGALGRVAHLVAPNRFHHLFVGDWRRRYPDAAIHVAPGLERKRGDLPISSLLGSIPDPAWADVLDQVALAGIPTTNEVVFFHRSSSTLIASDLAFQIGPESPALTRAAFRAMGAYGCLCPTPLERLLVRDRAAFRGSLERILVWPIERVVVAHGAVCESDGRARLARGYDWILGRGDDRASRQALRSPGQPDSRRDER